jgi:hypothetical protein
VIDDARLLFDELAGGKNGEVRDAAYGKSCSELLVFVGVNFENDSVTRHILCGTRDLGGCGSAWAAPFSPEIDEDRNARALDNLVEECGIDLQWFVEWGQRVLACAASAGIRKMVRGEAVFLAARFADSYRRHWITPNLPIRLF